jgi:hypothetical protein
MPALNTLYRRALLGVFVLAISTTAAWAQTFTLSATPKVTIHPGDQNVPVTINVGTSTYTGPIYITLTGLPSGISVSPLTLTAGTSGTVNLSATVAAGQELFNPLENAIDNTPSVTVNVVAIAGAAQITSTLSLTVSLENSSYKPAPGAINLPIVTINTSGVPIVDKTTDVPGTIVITSANGQTSYLPNTSDTDDTATFHLHGNTTLGMPKKAYHVKLTTSLDLLETMGLSCGYLSSKGKPACDKSKSYVLLANYDDKTFLRDWSASALANAIPVGGAYLNSPADSPTPSGTSTLMPWAPHSLFVELYLNGVYEGNYQLIEEVKVDGNRVNITELAETDVTDDITGGYLMEIDTRQDEDYFWVTPHGIDIGLIDPDFAPDPQVPEQNDYITQYVDTAETALFSSNFESPTLGWRPYFDEATSVDYHIVMDLMGNVDGGSMYSSDYLYKAKDNPLIYMGPVWDFDISSGNVNYKPIVDPSQPWMLIEARWWVQLYKDPGYKADAASQWNALKNNGVLAAWLASIPQEAATLQQSQVNNFGRWPSQGIMVWPDAEAVGSYNGEVAYLTNWLTVRMGYLDSFFNTKAATSVAIAVPGGTLRQGSPITLTATVSGGSGPTGQVAFLSNGVVLGLSTLTGSSATFTTGAFPPGTDAFEAVYVGDVKNALSVSTNTSVTVLAPFTSTTTALSTSSSTVTPSTPPTFTTVVVGNSGTTAPIGTVSFNANGQALGSVTLPPNDTVTLTPTSLPAGSVNVQAVYSGDSSHLPSSSSITLISNIAPLAQVLPSQITYPNIPFGSNETEQLTITNIGGGTLTLSTSIDGPSYQILPGSNCAAGVAANASCSLQIEFLPVSVGTHADHLTLQTNGATNPVVALTGTATGVGTTIAALPVRYLSFGTIPFGTTETLSLTVENVGVPGSPTVSFSINGPSYKVLPGSSCVSPGVTAGKSCTVQIQFAPAIVGVQIEILTVTPSTGLASTVPLDGTASPATP